MIIVFTGNGKGKTSAAMGTVMRSLGYKKKVIIIQFLKTGGSNEIKFLKNISKENKEVNDRLIVECFGKQDLTNPKVLVKKDYELAEKALESAMAALEKRPFLLVLDEVLVALDFKLIKGSEVSRIIENCKKNNINLVMTGRNAPKSIIDLADIVTEMRSVKHHYDEKIKARNGIDY